MLRKLLEPRIWKRIYLERLGEPLIYNVVSMWVLLFGNIRRKIDYDLIIRQPYAFGLKTAYERFLSLKKTDDTKQLVFIEFGVASGAGLKNICAISNKLTKEYGVDCKVIGFDAGQGMPKPVDYRDHPEKYLDGDFIPHDIEKLKKSLPENTNIIIGDIEETVTKIQEYLDPGDVIGFVSIDVDYWSSTKSCLKLFNNKNISFLPSTVLYLDDVNNIDHHEYAGELLAVKEFNKQESHQKIVKMGQLRNWRIFKNALWLDQMYWRMDFSHDYFSREYHKGRKRIKLSNPYLGQKTIS